VGIDTNGRWVPKGREREGLRDVRDHFRQEIDRANPIFAIAIETTEPDAIPWSSIHSMSFSDGEAEHSFPKNLIFPQQHSVIEGWVYSFCGPNLAGERLDQSVFEPAHNALKRLRECEYPRLGPVETWDRAGEWLRLLFLHGHDFLPFRAESADAVSRRDNSCELINRVAPFQPLPAAFTYRQIEVIASDVVRASAAFIDSLVEVALEERAEKPRKSRRVPVSAEAKAQVQVDQLTNRRRAVARAKEVGIRPAAKELGMSHSTLHGWVEAEGGLIQRTPTRDDGHEFSGNPQHRSKGQRGQKNPDFDDGDD